MRRKPFVNRMKTQMRKGYKTILCSASIVVVQENRERSHGCGGTEQMLVIQGCLSAQEDRCIQHIEDRSKISRVEKWRTEKERIPVKETCVPKLRAIAVASKKRPLEQRPRTRRKRQPKIDPGPRTAPWPV